MLKLWRTLFLLACAAAFVWAANEDSHAAEAEVATDQSSSSCYRSELSQYRQVFEEAFEIELGETAITYINCMSFDANKDLRSAIVSGNNTNGDEIVFEFSCRGSTLLAVTIQRDFSSEENESCVECSTNSSESACTTPCAAECERCYLHDTDVECSRCVAVVEHEGEEDCLEHCPQGKTPNPELNNVCECLDVLVYDVEDVITVLENLDSEEAESEAGLEEAIEGVSSASCEAECHDGFYTSEHGNTHICYACGVQFCAKCHEEEGGHGHGECTECLPHTEFYHEENECLYGLLAEILEVAEEQEHEVEEEEAEKEEARIQLAITLPIVCVVVIAFFIFMSFVAHKRYPHIGHTGQKRHRRKRSETLGEELSDQENVFKPRPTVRLR